MRLLNCCLPVALALTLIGCDQPPPAEEPAAAPPAEAPVAPAAEPPAEPVAEPAAAADTDSLDEILAAQPEATKARYPHRHPAETLAFFGIEPGMTVVEALPGGGWYTRILLPYLGADGQLIGANYAHDMWPKFGFFEDEFIEQMKTWYQDWPEQANAWAEDDAPVTAFDLGSMPAELEGTADAVLFIRALHNLARFESDGGYLTKALDDAYRILKPGGIVGVVQHEARPEKSDEWASGSQGYLKKSFVIQRMEDAGFEFVAESDINANPEDQPGDEDIVWRLPPTLMTSQENPELKAEMEAIGESNRMTLKFRKVSRD